MERMLAQAGTVPLQGPSAVAAGLVVLGVGLFMTLSARYRRWYWKLVLSLDPRAKEKSPHSYLAGALTITFFGFLAVVAGMIGLIKGAK
jgi:hypothetical protein